MRQIPANFRLLGHKVEVRLVPDLEELGRCHPDKLLIEIQSPSDDVAPAVALHTFLHEWVHMVFHYIGEEKLYEDERVVDLMAACLYQLLTTKRGKAADSPSSRTGFRSSAGS